MRNPKEPEIFAVPAGRLDGVAAQFLPQALGIDVLQNLAAIHLDVRDLLVERGGVQIPFEDFYVGQFRHDLL